MPSICQSGRNRFGKSSGMRPNTRRSPPIQPRDALEMDDVRVLVREDQPQPVVVLPIMLSPRRRRGGDLDRVVGDRRRPAVRQIGLVDEDDLHAVRAAGRDVSSSAPRTSSAIAASRRAMRFLALVKVDVEARRRDRPEPQPRIVAVRRGGAAGDAQASRADEQRAARQRHCGSAALCAPRCRARHPSGT